MARKLEKNIEKSVCSFAEERGWINFKMEGQTGLPDRLLIKSGVHVFIEFKRLGESMCRTQKYCSRKIEDHGGAVYTIDSIEGGRSLIIQLDNRIHDIDEKAHKLGILVYTKPPEELYETSGV